MSSNPASTLPASFSGPILLRFKELEEKVRRSRGADDLAILRDAFEFAADRHHEQKRKSGEPYLAHPVEVAHLLADMRLDLVCIATGLLHDVAEDTGVRIAEIKKRFGKEIGRCVDGVTKLSRLDYYSLEERQAENFRKMLLAMVEDVRVILVKLADRLHNMRTLGYLDADRQQRIARETLEIYAPIALRLGMGKVRGELEDVAFYYLEPQAYAEITKHIESRREAGEKFLAAIKGALEKRLAENGVPARIESRIKRAYSIHQKLKRQRITSDEVYDLLALRVITDSEKSCYAALGIIHSQWRPVSGRIKDFIAMPRPNLYQALHTSVIAEKGQTFEVQIRTEEMHYKSEQGICAHWKYKEGLRGPDVDQGQMAWLRQLVEWQRDVKDPSDFLSTLKIDLYPEEVYVFTPRGKLIVLPREATPVDFAYLIHSEVGHRCAGAKVNGRIVPLKYHFRNGDIVEIITQHNHPPSQDWLGFVKTSRARQKIKQWLNANRRKKAQEIGEKLLEKEARRLNVALKKVAPKALRQVCQDYGCAEPEDLYAALGYGKCSPRSVVARLAPEAAQPAAGQAAPEAAPSDGGPRPVSPGTAVLTVKGIDDILVYRARCCNPIRGEAIVGYVTRGKGVSVHSKDCSNVQNLMYEEERRMAVEWTQSPDVSYKIRLIIYVADRPGVLNELTSVLSEENINIRSVETRSTKGPNPLAIVELTIDIQDVKQLDRVTAGMRRVPGVREVGRRQRG